MKIHSVFTAAGVSTALAVLAATAGSVAAQQHRPYADIPVHQQSGIPYVSGGMTDAERKEMQRIANKYPMQLIFIRGESKEPINGVKVVVKDIKGNPQIEATADGPYFYFNPPSGRWTMDVELNGEVVSRTVDLVGRRYILLEFQFKGQS
jgi:hypothetical protein